MAYLRQIFTKIYRASNTFTKIIRANQFFEKTKTRFTVDYTTGAFALEGFDVTGVGNDITLEWTARGEFDNYRVYRSTDNQTFTMIVELGVGVEMYQDNDLTQDTYYYYVVGVLPSGVESLKTDVLSVFANEPPADPTNLGVTAENEQAVLTWDAVDDSNLLEYILYLDGVEVDRTTQTQFTFTGLTNGQQYTFGVQAIDELSATSGISDIIETVADTIAPAVPTGLSADGADTVADLSWDANSEPDLAGYNVYVDGVKDNGSLVTGTSYQATGLTNNTTVDFQVSAVDGDGNESALSDPVSEIIEDTVAPAAPVNFTVNDLNGIADLFWDASADSDFKESRVYLDGVFQGVTTSTTFQITGLTVGQQYTYEVSHVDTSDNESSKAQAVSVMADDIAPAAPTGLVAVGENGSADLSWDANSEPDLAGYNIYVNGVKDNSSVITATSYQVTGLTNGASYDFQVSAVDDFDNESPLSAIVSEVIEDTLAPATPTGLTVIPGDTALDCSWDANSEPDLAGYNVYVNGVKDNSSVITATSYQVTGLTNGVSYDIQVSAVDTSDNESPLSAIVSGTPAIQEFGIDNNSLAFFNSSESNRMDLDGIYDIGEKCTIQALVTLDSAVGTNATIYKEGLVDAAFGIELGFNGSEDLFLRVQGSGEDKTLTYNINFNDITNDNWKLVGGSFDGSTGEMKLYVDGDEVASTTTTNTAVNTGSGNGKIGQFIGKLDNLSIWDKVLTKEEMWNAVLHKDFQASGLLGYWDFEDLSEGTVNDQVSALVGTHSISNGILGAYPITPFYQRKDLRMVKDSNDNNINYNGDLLNFLGQNFTIEASFNLQNSAIRQGIIGKFNKNDTNDQQFLLRVQTDQALFVVKNDAGTQFSVWFTQGGLFPIADEQRHVAVTYDNSDLRLYVNGELKATQNIGSISYMPVSDFFVGGEDSDASNRFFEGELFDVVAYDEVKTDLEITEMAFSVVDQADKNLKFLTDFNDPLNPAQDKKLNFTVNSSSISSDFHKSNGEESGVLKNSLYIKADFAGNGWEIDHDDAVFDSITDDITIECWIAVMEIGFTNGIIMDKFFDGATRSWFAWLKFRSGEHEGRFVTANA